MKQVFSVGGMHCAACVKHVEDAVKQVDGITRCQVNLVSECMVCEGEFDAKSVADAVKKAGYTLTQSAAKKKKNDRFLPIRIAISFTFLALLLILSMGGMVGMPLPSFLRNPLYNGLVQLALCLPCLTVNYAYFINGIKGLFQGKPDMDSLIAVGSGAAFLSGIVTLAVYRGNGYLYFESAAMIVSLVTVGKYSEARTRKKTGEALEKLMALTPDTALVEADGKEIVVPAAEIPIGATVIVKQGEKIPCDGTVTDGEGYIDESAMTGESIPKEKVRDAKVIGGTVLSNGYLRIKAERTGEETTLSKIIESVETANMAKPHIARVADKVAAVFVPVVMGIAALTFCVWACFGEWRNALQCAISVLVVSCPCALGLATPVAVAVGTGKAAEKGILFRSPEAVERIGTVKYAVFDKTGTVTEGKPKPVTVRAVGCGEEELLSVAAAAESQSSHPLGAAICAYVTERGIAVPSAEDFSAAFGQGVYAAVEGRGYFVGKYEYVRAHTADEIPYSEEEATCIYVATKEKYLGFIGLFDAPTAVAKEEIEQLLSRGVQPYLLTGDNKKCAEKVAKEIGIPTENVIADVLPDRKAEKIKELKKFGTVTMVGDGINDAPALTEASVGIAVGGGSDIAVDSADIVLLHEGIRGINAVITIGKDTVRNIRQNLFWAFVYNILGIPIAAGVLYPAFGWTMSPMIGSATMSLSSLFVVMNALRYKYIHGGKKMSLCKKKERESGVVLHVEGMMCEHCKKRVEEAVRAVGYEGTVDLKKKTVTCPPGSDVEKIKKSVIDAGYEVK